MARIAHGASNGLWHLEGVVQLVAEQGRAAELRTAVGAYEAAAQAFTARYPKHPSANPVCELAQYRLELARLEAEPAERLWSRWLEAPISGTRAGGKTACVDKHNMLGLSLALEIGRAARLKELLQRPEIQGLREELTAPGPTVPRHELLMQGVALGLAQARSGDAAGAITSLRTVDKVLQRLQGPGVDSAQLPALRAQWAYAMSVAEPALRERHLRAAQAGFDGLLPAVRNQTRLRLWLTWVRQDAAKFGVQPT